MATDNEQLVLSISADTRQIQRQLKSLVGQTQANTKAIEDAFGGIDKASSTAFNGVAANSNRAFTAGAQNAKRFGDAMKQSNAQAINMTYQLQDIGVQLAGGQSPWLIGVQQISQMNLGAMGLRGTLTAIGGAAASILSPVNLAAIALVGLGGTAIQYFVELITKADESEEALRKQGDLIRNLAKEWGDVIPALREYADELERTQKIADLRAGAEILNTSTLEQVRTQIEDSRTSLASLVSDMQQSEEPEVIKGFQSAFEEFASAADDGSLKLEDVQSVQDALAAAINSAGIPSLISFKEMFDELSRSALGAAGSVQKLNAETGAATTRLYPSQGSYSGVDRSADGNIQNPGFTTPELGPVPDRRPTIELGTDDGSRAASQAAKTRAKAISDAERERKAVAALIEQLEFEQSLIGMTSAERAQANALRQAGSAATDEQRAKIAQLVEATYAERDAIRASEEAMQDLKDVSRDVLEGMVSDMRAGKSAADILANALGRVADKLVSSAFDGLFGGFGGGLGSLFGGGGTGSGLNYFPPAPREAGGPVQAGRPYIVGEKRPELFVPNVSGRIIPKVPGGTTSINFAPTINAAGADAAGLAAVRRDLAKMKADLPVTVKAAVRDGQKRRTL